MGMIVRYFERVQIVDIIFSFRKYTHSGVVYLHQMSYETWKNWKYRNGDLRVIMTGQVSTTDCNQEA